MIVRTQSEIDTNKLRKDTDALEELYADLTRIKEIIQLKENLVLDRRESLLEEISISIEPLLEKLSNMCDEKQEEWRKLFMEALPAMENFLDKEIEGIRILKERQKNNKLYKEKEQFKNEILNEILEEALFRAMDIRCIKTIEKLLEIGVDIDTTDANGRTALMRAVEGGIDNIEMIKFFLKKGSLVNASNHKAETPISIAYKNKYTEIVELLLEAGACDLIEEAYRKMIMKANKEEEK